VLGTSGYFTAPLVYFSAPLATLLHLLLLCCTSGYFTACFTTESFLRKRLLHYRGYSTAAPSWRQGECGCLQGECGWLQVAQGLMHQYRQWRRRGAYEGPLLQQSPAASRMRLIAASTLLVCQQGSGESSLDSPAALLCSSCDISICTFCARKASKETEYLRGRAQRYCECRPARLQRQNLYFFCTSKTSKLSTVGTTAS
jgi:hypothetical protein